MVDVSTHAGSTLAPRIHALFSLGFVQGRLPEIQENINSVSSSSVGQYFNAMSTSHELSWCPMLAQSVSPETLRVC
jgi:hypothetical protein